MNVPSLKVKLLASDFERLIANFRYNKERMAIAFGYRARGSVVIPPDGLLLLDDACFDLQSAGFVKLNGNVNNQIHALFAGSPYTAYVHLHSHPFENLQVNFSGTDDAADRDLDAYLNGRFLENTAARPEGALDSVRVISGVFGQRTAKFRMIESNEFFPVQIVTIGERINFSGTGEVEFNAP